MIRLQPCLFAVGALVILMASVVRLNSVEADDQDPAGKSCVRQPPSHPW